MPVQIDCNFVVDSTNGNGLGIRSLKGPYVKAVYMHTSATPDPLNPNPASGTILVQMSDNFNRSYTGGNAIVSPVSGTPIAILASGAALTPGVAYVIVSLGTSTSADWHTLGVPAGVSPAVGVAFIALATGAGVGSGSVEITAAAGSGIASIETVGDPNLSISPDQSLQSYGASFILQCRDYAGAIAAPANGSVISLAFLLSNSSVLIQGE